MGHALRSLPPPSGLEMALRHHAEVALCILSLEDRQAWWEGLARPGQPRAELSRAGEPGFLWATETGERPARCGHALARTAAPGTLKLDNTCHSESVITFHKNSVVIQQLFMALLI